MINIAFFDPYTQTVRVDYREGVRLNFEEHEVYDDKTRHTFTAAQFSELSSMQFPAECVNYPSECVICDKITGSPDIGEYCRKNFSFAAMLKRECPRYRINRLDDHFAERKACEWARESGKPNILSDPDAAVAVERTILGDLEVAGVWFDHVVDQGRKVEINNVFITQMDVWRDLIGMPLPPLSRRVSISIELFNAAVCRGYLRGYPAQRALRVLLRLGLAVRVESRQSLKFNHGNTFYAYDGDNLVRVIWSPDAGRDASVRIIGGDRGKCAREIADSMDKIFRSKE